MEKYADEKYTKFDLENAFEAGKNKLWISFDEWFDAMWEENDEH